MFPHNPPLAFPLVFLGVSDIGNRRRPEFDFKAIGSALNKSLLTRGLNTSFSKHNTSFSPKSMPLPCVCQNTWDSKQLSIEPLPDYNQQTPSQDMVWLRQNSLEISTICPGGWLAAILCVSLSLSLALYHSLFSGLPTSHPLFNSVIGIITPRLLSTHHPSSLTRCCQSECCTALAQGPILRHSPRLKSIDPMVN